MSWEQIITLITPLIVAIIVYLKSHLETKAIKEQIKSIEDALETSDYNYYVICPECKTKVSLSKVKLFRESKEEEKDDELQK